MTLPTTRNWEKQQLGLAVRFTKFITKFAKPEKQLKFHEICQGGRGHMYYFTKFHCYNEWHGLCDVCDDE